MPWYGWAIVALITASALITVGMVGKPRKPTEPGTAVMSVVLNGLIIWAILKLGGAV